jgi:hypothetical protein
VDLEPMEAACVSWLLRHLENQAPFSARMLAREMHISDHAARDFLAGTWPGWCQSQLSNSRAPESNEHVVPQKLENITAKLRAAVEPHRGAAPSDSQKERRSKAVPP